MRSRPGQRTRRVGGRAAVRNRAPVWLALAVAVALVGCGKLPGIPSLSGGRPAGGEGLPGVLSPVATKADAGLAAVVSAVAARHEGTLGMAVKNLRTGSAATLNAGQRVRAASLYKLFVLYVATMDIQRGKLGREEMLTLSQEAVSNERYAEWAPGTRTTASCALEAMVEVSNNAAAAMLVERLGGEERITAEMRALGLRQSELTAERAYTSAADIALLLESIATGRAGNAPASQDMLRLLLGQRRNDRLPLPLPLVVQVAHKTGELANLRHDAGIVYAPSGPYVIVALVDDAESEAAARQAIVDLSSQVYGYFEPKGLAEYMGLPPRLAREVFQVPDGRGRLTPLSDGLAETLLVGAAGVPLTEGAEGIRLREMVVPYLAEMGEAASAAGADFWVSGGYEAPTPGDAPLVADEASALPCRVALPGGMAGEGEPKAAAARAALAPQSWLGTVVTVSDARDEEPSVAEPGRSAAGRWLAAHGWEYGFVLAPAETPEGERYGYEPWKLRWVGRSMAARLHRLGYESNPTAITTAELRQALRELGKPE